MQQAAYIPPANFAPHPSAMIAAANAGNVVTNGAPEAAGPAKDGKQIFYSFGYF